MCTWVSLLVFSRNNRTSYVPHAGQSVAAGGRMRPRSSAGRPRASPAPVHPASSPLLARAAWSTQLQGPLEGLRPSSASATLAPLARADRGVRGKLAGTGDESFATPRSSVPTVVAAECVPEAPHVVTWGYGRRHPACPASPSAPVLPSLRQVKRRGTVCHRSFAEEGQGRGVRLFAAAAGRCRAVRCRWRQALCGRVQAWRRVCLG